MRLLTFLLPCFLLVACQGGDDQADKVTPIDAPVSAIEAVDRSVELDGQITLSPEPLISEIANCIVPLRVSNGTGAEVTVSMFGFTVTGEGEDDSGNMFGQATPAGEYRTSRIIQIGQSCEAFDTITLNDVQCKQASGEACEVIFEDSPQIEFASSPE